jgi:putative ATP-binding cassette transporter
MNFFEFIKSEGSFSNKMIFVNSLSGVLAIVIATIIVDGSDSVESNEIQLGMIILFVSCVIAYYISRYYALSRISTHVEYVINETRKRISGKIQKTNLRNFEGIGKEYFYTTLTTDSQIISQSSIQIINATGSLVMVITGVIALLIISVSAFMVVITILIAITSLYLSMRKLIVRDLIKISEKENQFFEALNDLLLGFKELKLNNNKSEDFIKNTLHQLANEEYELKALVAKNVSRAIILSQIFMYIIIGTVVFVLPNIKPDEVNIIAPTVALLLFMNGPIIEVVGMVSLLDRTNNCINNLQKIENTLDSFKANQGLTESPESRIKSFSGFQVLKCEDAVFSYQNEKNNTSFTMEPVNFELKNNEVVFIIGGNGSGKSTFLKMLTSLYTLDEGKIYIDDKPLQENQLTAYRSLFSPIFVDFHLFEKLYGYEDVDYEKVDFLLDEMELANITDIVDGKITKRTLSTGQRKRLALIVSILDDREIFLFDEVAADQDPSFRKYFYETIIPKLKSDGKTIIAVTHDDKYFSTADRILKMNYGKLAPYID